ncbi:MAG TPA: LamG domain-containing protein, partial [Flavobacteriales bacterium]|nr:LamG domain-containing protein [Flavobacteriales bacterium]
MKTIIGIVVCLFLTRGTVSAGGGNALALNFDGSNDYVQTQVPYSLSSWTYECWVIAPTAPGSLNSSGPMYGENAGITWNHSSSAFRGVAFVRDASGAYLSASFGALSSNTWYHLAATYDGSVLKSYKNGVLMNTTTSVGGGVFSPVSGNLKLGAHPLLSGFFSGIIDEARVWDYARTCEEINDHMNLEFYSSSTGLIASYNFNESASVNGNNTSITALYNSANSVADGVLTNFGLNGAGSNFITGGPFNAPLQCQGGGTSVACEALRFDGVDDHIVLPTDGVFNVTEGTIEAWIKTSASNSGYQGIVVKEFAYGIFLMNNKLGAFNWPIGTAITTTTNLNDGNWHHVAMAFEIGIPSGIKLYIDGSLSATGTIINVSGQSGTLIIGNNESQNSYFEGSIDGVRFWNRALCGEEIFNNMNCQIVGAVPDLVAVYNFNQGQTFTDNSSEITLVDASGNGYDGMLTNFNLSSGNTTSNWV